MENFKIHRPVFERKVKGGIEYSIEMQQHLQELDDFYKMLGEVDEEGWGICQMWVMQHKDGRVANLPDVCPYEQMRRRAERREKAWMRYYMKKREKINKQEKSEEMKEKNVYNGAVLFDGNFNITTKDGKKHTLRVDYLGTTLKNADTDKELLLLLQHNTQYCELTTGYLCRRDKWEEMEQPMFGLYPFADKDEVTLYKYAEVMAWGYVDGGLNDKSKFYSCQCTQAQEAELERKREAIRRGKESELEVHDESKEYDGIEMKFQIKDGQVGVQVIVAKNHLEDYLVAAKKHLDGCMQDFIDFTEKHPAVNEIHYYTKPTEWKDE